jgi:signal transduction histidine kinase
MKRTGKSKTNLLFLMIGILASLSFIYACAPDDQGNSKKQKLVYGSNIFPPFEFLNKKGEAEGFNIDLIKAIGERMDFEVVFQLEDWAKMKDKIKNKEGIDIGDMYVNDERKEYVDFASVHAVVYHEFVTKKQAYPKLSLDKISGLKLLVEGGTSVHEYFLKNNHDAIITAAATEPEILRLLRDGKYDCAIVTQYSSNNYIIDNDFKDLTISGAPIFPLQLAFHVQKGNEELLEKINKGLTQVKLDGTYSKIYSKWFELGDKKTLRNRLNVLIWLSVITSLLLFLSIAVSRYLKKAVKQKTAELELRVNEIGNIKNTLSEQNHLLKEAYKQLDTFVYSISHHIRGPVSSVLGVLNLMKMEFTDNSRLNYIGMIESSLHRLEKFTRGISDYLISVKDNSTLAKVDFNQMVEDIFKSTVLDNTKTNIELLIENKTKGDTITLDKNKLTVILSSIIANSIQYCDTKKQSSFIKVSIEKEEENFKISIEDNGVGIQEEYISSVFEIFFRANQKSQGSGLGLYIAKEAVNKMNGTIQLISRQGAGSKFTIIIPQVRSLLAISTNP